MDLDPELAHVEVVDGRAIAEGRKRERGRESGHGSEGMEEEQQQASKQKKRDEKGRGERGREPGCRNSRQQCIKGLIINGGDCFLHGSGTTRLFWLDLETEGLDLETLRLDFETSGLDFETLGLERLLSGVADEREHTLN